MAIASIGDLASSMLMRGHNARLNASMEKISQELASGQVAVQDVSVGGSYRAISGIERSLSRLSAFELAASEAGGFADGVQTSLGSIQETAENISLELLSTASSESKANMDILAKSAIQDFEAVIGWLNASFADRSIFAGAATDSAAVADAASILEQLEMAIAGETTAAGVAAVVEDWFAPPADPATPSNYFLGSNSLSPMEISPERAVSLDITAANDDIRNTLIGLALGALVDTAPISSVADEQFELAEIAGNKLIAANRGLIDLRATVGAAQESIERTLVEIQAETHAMDIALNDILAVDPYERATELTHVESQIEMLYTLTVRSSNLRLANYL